MHFCKCGNGLYNNPTHLNKTNIDTKKYTSFQIGFKLSQFPIPNFYDEKLVLRVLLLHMQGPTKTQGVGGSCTKHYDIFFIKVSYKISKILISLYYSFVQKLSRSQ